MFSIDLSPVKTFGNQTVLIFLPIYLVNVIVKTVYSFSQSSLYLLLDIESKVMFDKLFVSDVSCLASLSSV